MISKIEVDSKATKIMDTRGLCSPQLFSTLGKVIRTEEKGNIVEIVMNDPVTMLYILAWIKYSNCEMIRVNENHKKVIFQIRL